MARQTLGMKLLAVIVAAGLNVAFVNVATAEVTKMEGEELLPPNAKAGECYARIFIPPTYRTVTEQVLKSEASERVEIIPAKTETATERILVQEASKKLEVVPATYGWEEETVLVKPAITRLVEVPAIYNTITEQVIDKPAHTVWKKGKGSIQSYDNATGEIMCLVEVPATYKTITKRVLKSPATTREIEIPAEYETVKRRVMKTPPKTREIEIPAEYQTVQVTKSVHPAQERRIPVPAQYQNVSRTEQLTEGRMEWQPVLCEINATTSTVKSIQLALKKAGYDPGQIDGIVGESTMNAVRRFQIAKGLPEGQMTVETIKALGVSF